MKTYKDIDAYLVQFPKEVRATLQKLRETIKKAAPGAQEKIAYGIPTLYLHGNLVHFGGFAKHISFFPGSSGVKAFTKELSTFRTSKGTIQFPLSKPLPWALITKIVKFRVKENSYNA